VELRAMHIGVARGRGLGDDRRDRVAQRGGGLGDQIGRDGEELDRRDRAERPGLGVRDAQALDQRAIIGGETARTRREPHLVADPHDQAAPDREPQRS
jgi:hypothetical protein